MDLFVLAAGCHDLGNRRQYCIDRAVVWAPAGQIRIKTVAHHRYGIGRIRACHRQLRYHGLRLGQLIFTAVRHKYACCTDGSIKHFHQALLGADIQICQYRKPCRFLIARFQCFRCFFGSHFLQRILFLLRNIHGYAALLMCAVGIQERSGKVYDIFAAPLQHQTGFFGNNRHFGRFQIFLIRIFHKFRHILRIDDDRHTLLGFGDCQFRTVQTGIFLRHLVQIHGQTVCQLTDGNGYTARTKVVALLDQTAHFRPAEQTLQLTLGRCITFLYFRAAHLDGLLGMYLGRSCSTAAAVTAGTSAEQDDDIARIGSQTHYILSGSSTHHGADLHTLCHIVRVVYFLNIAGGQTDLVTIGRITVCRTANQFLLWQLAL